jgi:hypothetical protein
VFVPYLSATLEVVGPLLHFYLNDEVRSYAMACMPELLQCALAGAKAGAIDPAQVRTVYTSIVSAMLVCLPKEPEHELLMTLASSLQQAVELGAELGPGGLLDAASLLEVARALVKVLTNSADRMRERNKQRGQEDWDKHEEQRLKRENEAEDELNFLIAECVGGLIKSHREAFLPAFECLLPELARLWGPDLSTPESTKIALFVADDFIEALGVSAVPYYPQLVPALLEHAMHPRPEVRQAAAFGVGLCAQHGGAGFRPYVSAALEVLGRASQWPDARTPVNASPTDNVISALGKIAMGQDRPDLLPVRTEPLLWNIISVAI